ncbi:MAG: GNAT family N-acetyltransferase [Saprospiraceae bacterium]
MIIFKKTDSSSKDFRLLIKALDAGLLDNYKEAQSWYDQFNKLDDIKHVIVAYEKEQPLACGAIKQFDEESMEVKRMYVTPEARGKGLASKLLLDLELWAKSLGYKKCVLETGTLQKAAIGLYQNRGYKVVSNYGQYAGVETSICFEKILNV